MQRDALAGEADLEHAFTERRTALDELAEGVRRHRVGDAPPLDEGKDGMDPSHLDIGGVEAHPWKDRHHRCLERQPLCRCDAGRRVRPVVHPGRQEDLGAGVDLGDRSTAGRSTSSSKKLSFRSRNGRSILPLRFASRGAQTTIAVPCRRAKSSTGWCEHKAPARESCRARPSGRCGRNTARRRRPHRTRRGLRGCGCGRSRRRTTTGATATRTGSPRSSGWVCQVDLAPPR